MRSLAVESLQQFAASPHQLLATPASNASPIGIHCVAFGVLIDPVLSPAIRFADLGAESQCPADGLGTGLEV